MTWGLWTCQVCDYKTTLPIYQPVYKCPECGAEYDVEFVSGMHIVHSVAVHTLKGTNKKSVPVGAAMAVGSNFGEYLEILKEQEENDEDDFEELEDEM